MDLSLAMEKAKRPVWVAGNKKVKMLWGATPTTRESEAKDEYGR